MHAIHRITNAVLRRCCGWSMKTSSLRIEAKWMIAWTAAILPEKPWGTGPLCPASTATHATRRPSPWFLPGQQAELIFLPAILCDSLRKSRLARPWNYLCILKRKSNNGSRTQTSRLRVSRSAESWRLSHRRNVFRSHSHAQYIRGKLWSALRVLAREPSLVSRF